MERDTVIARAVRADQLYNKYYSSSNSDFVYVIAAASLIGPVFFIMLVVMFSIAKARIRAHRPISRIMKSSLRGKTLVALVILGVYISVYILILDIFAAHYVRTSHHEYATELSERNPFNLVVSYFTLACDIAAFIVVPLFIFLKNICNCWPGSCFNLPCKSCKKEDDDDCVLLCFLIAPVMCITSHLGYILLAWLTQPSRSTTTLILYYFLFSYMFLSLRMSYKGCKRIREPKQPSSYRQSSPRQSSFRQSSPRQFLFEESSSSTVSSDVQQAIHPVSYRSGSDEEDSTSNPGSAHSSRSDENSKGIDMCAFLVTFFLLGPFYLGAAVIFVMMVYLTPLASEDLFNYILNVIEFIIVVVSTQYAYKLFVAKRFSFKQGLKYINRKITDHAKKTRKKNKRGDTEAVQAVGNKNKQGFVEETVDLEQGFIEETVDLKQGFVEKTVDLFSKWILIPHMDQVQRREKQDKTQSHTCTVL